MYPDLLGAFAVPIYEFDCPTCDKHFEELVRSDAERKQVACPQCGEKKVRQALSVFAARADSTDAGPQPGPCGRCGDPDGPCSWG